VLVGPQQAHALPVPVGREGPAALVVGAVAQVDADAVPRPPPLLGSLS
jgi:hypothetical protein